MQPAADVTPNERLCRGLVVLPCEEGLVVEGAHHRHHFHGAAATGVLPSLLSALDGSRDVGTLGTELGLTPRQLGQALTLLRDRGLLEHADPQEDDPAPPEHVVVRLSRQLGTAGGFRSTAELCRELAGAAVYVASDGDLAHLVADDLRECGIGAVVGTGAPRGAEARMLRGAASALVVLPELPAPPAGADELLAWCGRSGIPVLCVTADDSLVELGPTILRGHTACARCVRRSRADAGWAPRGPVGPATTLAAAGLTVTQALHQVARVRGAEWLQTLLRVDLDDWRSERYLALPYADCPACGPGVHGETDDAALLRAYESSVSVSGLTRLTPRGVKLPYETASWGKLATSRRPYPAHPRRTLGSGLGSLSGAFGRPAEEEQVLDGAVLGGILRRVAGTQEAPVEDRQDLRWAPTGGNLASVEAYVLGEPDLLDLPGTVAWYDDRDHALVGVSADRLRLFEALRGTDLTPERIAAVIVLVGAWKRLQPKYDHFAKRLALLDAGVASTQLAAVAGGYGLRVTFASRWDDGISDLLEVVPEHRFVTVVAGIEPSGRR